MAFQKVSPQVWISKKNQKVPVFGNIGVCCTLFELEQCLFIISPVDFDNAEKTFLTSFKKQSFLVSPNALHHLWLSKALEILPQAKLVGPYATANKRKDLSFSFYLTPNTPYPWSAEVNALQVLAKPPIFEEFVFFHKPSKTWVVTDLLFNVHTFESWMGVLAMKLNLGYKKLTTTRLGRMTFKNKDLLRKVANEMISSKPENIIVAHGEPVLGNGTKKLQEAFQWLK